MRLLALLAAPLAGLLLTSVEAGAAAAKEKDYTEESAVFALGNSVFTLHHEVGHALIAEFELPVLGHEEGAVDQFASVLLTPDADDKDQDVSILVDCDDRLVPGVHADGI